MKRFPLLLSLALIVAGAALAANEPVIENTVKEFTLDQGGSLWLQNGIGNIEVIGTDNPGLFVTAAKVMTAVDDAALREAREQTALVIGGDSRVRALQTVIPPEHMNPLRSERWSSYVSYSIHVPRTTHVKISANSGDKLRVSNISGNLFVKNVNGEIELQNITGPITVESINGSIVADFPTALNADAQLNTVNGQIEVIVPSDGRFQWQADTATGDILTTLASVRGFIDGTSFRGNVNAPGGPTLTTSSMMGRVFVLKAGSSAKEASSVSKFAKVRTGDVRGFGGGLIPARALQQPFVDGNLEFSTSLGNVSIGEIRGDARIETGAGEVELGSVLGKLDVTSLGGPLNLGEVGSAVNARTSAGDIVVRAAKMGGTLWTDGGAIRVLYTNGPTTLHSGGGDIVVWQASGPINAETRSGDITITIDPAVRSQRVEARTTEGNITLRVTPKFAANIDATITTSNPNGNVIQSDLTGLVIDRRQVGNRIRIHATGKVNGGGEKVELVAEEGDIHIVGQNAPPIKLMTQSDH